MVREELKSHRLRAGALLASVALIVAGCGSSAKKAGTVSAISYVGAVCNTIASWYSNISSRARNLESSFGPRTKPAEAKSKLENYLALTLADTESAASALKGAGIPKVANGQRIASSVVAAFEHASTQLQQAQKKVAGLATTSTTTFLNEARQLGSTIQDLPLTVSTGFAGANNAELDKAAAESPTCKRVGARPRQS